MLPAQISFSTELDKPAERLEMEKFDKPFCMIGNGKHDQPFKAKLKILKRYQKNISRKKQDFNKNKTLEKNLQLVGTPKWITYKYLKNQDFSNEEIDFAIFSMTLFAEAKNLDEKNIEMVARVINNRRKNKSYLESTTKLAQFSSWYYKNQRDNVIILCPGKIYHKHWAKIIAVAKKHFYYNDKLINSTHYFAPYNMVPRYKIPLWAKGKMAVRHGGHLFIVSKDYQSTDEELTPVFIPKNAQKVKIKNGKMVFLGT